MQMLREIAVLRVSLENKIVATIFCFGDPGRNCVHRNREPRHSIYVFFFFLFQLLFL